MSPFRLSPDEEQLGLAWWNAMSRLDRSQALAAAEELLQRPASIAEAWLAWKASPSGRGYRPAPRPTPETKPLPSVAANGIYA
jgi:hypothetical protein